MSATAVHACGALLWLAVGVVVGWYLCHRAHVVLSLGKRHRDLNGVRARGFRAGRTQGFRDAAELLGVFTRLLDSVAADPESDRAEAAAMAAAALNACCDQLRTTAESLEAGRS